MNLSGLGQDATKIETDSNVHTFDITMNISISMKIL